MNIEHSESKIVLLKDGEWSWIDGELCRVTDFGALGSFVDANGKVHAMNKTMPYASVTIECKKLGKNVMGYITHKEDFKHLWMAFKRRKVNDNETLEYERLIEYNFHRPHQSLAYLAPVEYIEK